jgi:hypothetical protein
MYDRSERDLVRAFTGLVVESLAVTQDVSRGTVHCRRCADRPSPSATEGLSESGDAPSQTGPRPSRLLEAGDSVVVVVNCYEGHSWEIQAVYCEAHGAAIDTVSSATAIRAEDQAVVTAVLEPAGYHAPDGRYHPDALTLGQVDIRDYSPTTEGY